MSKDNKKTGQTPAKTETTAMTAPPPEGSQAIQVHDYGDHTGRGYEHQDKDDRTIPFLNIIQSNSDKVLQAYKQSRPGMIWNTVTEEFYDGDEGVIVIPAVTKQMYCEFVPRLSGGGFKGQHEPNSEFVKQAIKKAQESGADFGSYKTPDGSGHELVQTFYVYCALGDLEGNALGMGVLAFSKTKIKVYKNWQTRLGQFMVTGPGGRKINPPLYAHLCRVGTYSDKNAKGTYYNFTTAAAVDDDMMKSLMGPGDERFQLAHKVYELVESGAAKVDFSKQGAPDAADATGGEGAKDTVF